MLNSFFKLKISQTQNYSDARNTELNVNIMFVVIAAAVSFFPCKKNIDVAFVVARNNISAPTLPQINTTI